MGLFDTVIIEGLKLKAPREVTSFLKSNNAEFPKEFQTKDLDSAMSVYTIKENGNIYIEERIPTGKKIPFNYPTWSWNDSRPYLERLYFKFKNKQYNISDESRLVDETKTVKVKSNITNTFFMLSYDEIGGRHISLDYEVKAVNGKVKSIKLKEWSIESEEEASQRHKSDQEFKLKRDESFAKRKEFQSRWYYPVLREVYNPIIFFSRIAIQSICNKIVSISYRWTGV